MTEPVRTIHTQCGTCSFFSKPNKCYAGRIERWANNDLISQDDNGDPLVDGICNLHTTNTDMNLDLLLQKMKDATRIPVSFFIICRDNSIAKLKHTLENVLASDLADNCEIKICVLAQDAETLFVEVTDIFQNHDLGDKMVLYSIEVKLNKDEDDNFILSKSMASMKNSFIIVVEADNLVPADINARVNKAISEDLKLTLFTKEEGWYGVMAIVAKQLHYYAYVDLREKLDQTVPAVSLGE